MEIQFFFGIEGHGKGHKVKQLKNIIFHFFGDRFGILGEFPLRIWFSDPHGTCRFELEGF